MKFEKSRRHAGKHIPAALLSAFLILAVFCTVGCKAGGFTPAADGEHGRDEGEKLNVVTTLFPYYDFLRQIGGDRITLTMVLPAGMDSHSFEPTPADVITMQNADVLVCNGGEMEQWLTRVLDSLESGSEGPGRVAAMLDYVEISQEEIVEGMEAEEHEHDFYDADVHDADAHGNDGHEVEIEYDEHIWTSPVNAIKLTAVLADILCEEDPGNTEFYRENASAYERKLKELDCEIRDIVENGRTRLVVLGDKFPLRYFFDEYGLKYRAAFTGCSTDTEPSAKTIAYLIDKVREDQLTAVFYLELSSHRVAEIIGEETSAEPLLFHSCHNVTRKEFDSGVTYLELMERNAANLRKGLN